MNNEFDLSHPPFDLLNPEEQNKLLTSLDLGYFSAGETLIEAQGQAEQVYVLIKGGVAEIDLDYVDQPDAGVLREYASEDHFGAISIINGHSRYAFKTLEETITWQIPKAVFEELLASNSNFANYFQTSLTKKLRAIEERRSQREGAGDMSSFMMAKVSESVLREAVVLDPKVSIAEATRTMREQDADCLLVQKDGDYGMVTRTDLLEGLALKELPLENNIADLATYKLLSVQKNDFLFHALILMTRHKVQRIVVFDKQKLLGLVELTDVLSFFSSQSHVIGLQIERARNLEELARAAKGTTSLISGLMAQGVKIRFAMDLIAALNSRIMAKAFEFIVPEEYHDKVCLLVMGSEGRGEQVLKTDQDNGLILADDLHWPDRQKYLDKFTLTLLDFGYPLCKGKIMVSNPEWVKTESEWKETLTKWSRKVDGTGQMNLAIYLDAQGIAGNRQLFKDVRESIFETVGKDAVFFSYFAMPIKSFNTPLTFFGGLKDAGGLDIKKGGIFPIVHGVRALALQQKLKVTNTFLRLEQLVERKVIKKKFAENLAEALAVMSQLRLEQQLKSAQGDAPPEDANLIAATELNKLDRDLLREALHLVKEFKSMLSRKFNLDR